MNNVTYLLMLWLFTCLPVGDHLNSTLFSRVIDVGKLNISHIQIQQSFNKLKNLCLISKCFEVSSFYYIVKSYCGCNDLREMFFLLTDWIVWKSGEHRSVVCQAGARKNLQLITVTRQSEIVNLKEETVHSYFVVRLISLLDVVHLPKRRLQCCQK